MLELRNPRTIALELLSASYLPHLSQDHSLPFIEIAGDFVFLDSLSAKNETEGRDALSASRKIDPSITRGLRAH